MIATAIGIINYTTDHAMPGDFIIDNKTIYRW